MKRGSVYKLNNFYGSKNKTVYQVSDHAVTVSFSWNSELSVLEDSTTPFDEDSFRFHSYAEFEANCDLKGDLYGKLSNSHVISDLHCLMIGCSLIVSLSVSCCLDAEITDFFSVK